MTIFGKRLSEYVGFVKVFLVLVFVVGALRLALSLAGVSDSTTRWLSMTAVVWLGVLYNSIRVHTSGFGSYKQLLPAVALPNLVAQAISIVAIVIAIYTGTDNVYSAPEAAFGQDGKTWLHAGAHLVIGTIVGSLVAWIVGCLIMFITKKMADKDAQAVRAR